MHRYASLIWLVYFGLIACQAHAQHAPASAEKEQQRLMSLLNPEVGEWPKLVVNKEPATCQGYLKAIQTSFTHHNHYVTLKDGLDAWGAKSLLEISPDKELVYNTALPTITVFKHKPITGFAIIGVDLEPDGTPETLLFRWVSHSWRGYNYGLHLIHQAPSHVAERVEQLGKDYNPLDEGIELQNEGLWLPPTVVLTDSKDFYFTTQFSDSFAPDGNLYKITPAGAELVCTVGTYPTNNLPIVFDDYFNTLTNMQGKDCQGTLNSITRTKLLNNTDRLNLLSRPWSLRRITDKKDVIMRALEAWSYYDPWSRHQYLKWLRQLPLVKDEIQKMLMRDFDIPANEPDLPKLSESLFWRITGTHFIFGNSGFEQLVGKRDVLLSRLYRGEISAKELKTIFERESADPKNPKYLFAVLDQPGLIKELVAMGANVNGADPNGKTALMYAAQLDKREAVAHLLKLSADINAQMHPANYQNISSDERTEFQDWCLWHDSTPRTALTYAAANASYKTIRLLLDAGADPSIHSKYTNIATLVDKNPSLMDREKEKIRKRLAKHP